LPQKVPLAACTSTFVLLLPASGIIMQTVVETDAHEPILPSESCAAEPTDRRPAGRVWIVLGVIAALVGVGLGLVMSTVGM
jgi:hypothetical protein